MKRILISFDVRVREKYDVEVSRSNGIAYPGSINISLKISNS